jgi:transposase
MHRFVASDRTQPFLLPPDLKDWVPQDDLAHFVVAAAERVDMAAFKVNGRGSGSEQYNPRMMLALLIYCYANGIFGSRRIERATYRDVAVRFVTANTHPDHDTICAFRRENAAAIAECFLKVLELARELKLLKLGTISVDGTKIDANANTHRSVRYDRACELREQLRLEIAELMQKAEQSDASGAADPQTLPAEIARREALQAQLDAACARLEKEAKARAEAERADYERRKAVHENGEDGRNGGGKPPSPPRETPEPKAQSNLTDPDSRLMRKNKRSEYRQSYNAQVAVDADGSQLVVSARISQCPADANELVANVDAIPPSIGTPSCALADTGFANGAEVATLEARGTEVLVATAGTAKRRPHDFRPTPTVEKPKPEPKAPWIKAMQAKLAEAGARARYKLRKQTVEPVFGIIKSVLGFRQFRLRGLSKVETEWKLVTLAYNAKRLHAMMAAAKAA